MDDIEIHDQALDEMCDAIRNAVFTAREKGIPLHQIDSEATSALDNALSDAEDMKVGG